MAAEEKLLADKKFQEEAKTRSKEMNELIRTAMVLEEQRNACWEATKKLKRRMQPFQDKGFVHKDRRKNQGTVESDPSKEEKRQ